MRTTYYTRMKDLKQILNLTYPFSAIAFLFFMLGLSCLAHKTPEYYYTQGKNETVNTDYYKAINNFTRAIKLKPGYREAYIERANANMAVDSILNAIRDYDSILVMVKTVAQKGEFTYKKAYAHYLLNGRDSIYCKLVTIACDQYGFNVACDKRRIHCK